MSPPDRLGDPEKARDDKAESTSIAVDSASDDLFLDTDPVYQAKARILNEALQEIGMGRYQVRRLLPVPSQALTIAIQWQLFVVTGFGWMA